MSVGSILPGRLPISLLARRQTQSMEAGARALAELQQQIASGQQFSLPSDAPSAAIKSVLLQKAIERTAQTKKNLQTDRSFLAASESALSNVSESLNQAKSFVLAGIGNTLSSSDKQALAVEVAAIRDGVLRAANTQFRGRYLFGGSQSQAAPFELIGNGIVRYNGDTQHIDSLTDIRSLMANNVDGDTAFDALTEPVGQGINPALTLDTQMTDLHRGAGVELHAIVVTLDNGGTPQTATVDLSGAKTVGDIKIRLENAFVAGPLTLSVDVDPATANGFRLTPSAGTITVADVSGSTVAADLGIAAASAAQITGGDLDPRLTTQTRLADLNGGSGIDQSNGLSITNGSHNTTVDISSDQTIEDLFNALLVADPNLDVGINVTGNGLALSSRLSGATFSIGENSGSTATDLGIRTLNGTSLLTQLNRGQGVPVDAGENLEVTRRDGSSVSIDLSGTRTVQDALDAINSVDPGNLVASLNTIGNGITIVDNSGVGSLSVQANNVGTALGMAGTDNSGNAATPLVGQDVNPRETTGVIGILSALEAALRNEDNRELSRVSQLIDSEIDRFNQVRGELGSRQKLLDEVETRTLDQEAQFQEQLSLEFDTDLTSALTRLVQQQQALEATYRLTAQSFQLSLLSFL